MASLQLAPDRLLRLTRLFDSVLHGKRAVSDSRIADQFLESLISQPDWSKAIEKLVANSPALDALQKSLRYDTSSAFLNHRGTQLLNYLAEPELARLCNGQFLRQFLSIVVDPPTFWTALVGAHNNHELTESTSHCFAWLIWQLLAFQATEPVNLEAVAIQLTDKKSFIDSSKLDTRTLGHKIKDILALKQTKMLPDINGYHPGGRHDNYFVNFRDISIIPTADELSSNEKSYYVRTTDIVSTDIESRMGLHIDNQFRLLREDMLGNCARAFRLLKTNGKAKVDASH